MNNFTGGVNRYLKTRVKVVSVEDAVEVVSVEDSQGHREVIQHLCSSCQNNLYIPHD
jgi:hypothetical protein